MIDMCKAQLDRILTGVSPVLLPVLPSVEAQGRRTQSDTAAPAKGRLGSPSLVVPIERDETHLKQQRCSRHEAQHELPRCQRVLFKHLPEGFVELPIPRY